MKCKWFVAYSLIWITVQIHPSALCTKPIHVYIYTYINLYDWFTCFNIHELSEGKDNT